MTGDNNPVTLRCVKWRPLPRAGGLLGFASIELRAYGTIIDNVPIFTAKGGPKAGPPTSPMIAPNGNAVTRDGKIVRVPTLSFRDEVCRDRFLAGVVVAIRRAFPDALPTNSGG